MAKGGARPGAGRKSAKEMREARLMARKTGKGSTPLEFLLHVMNDTRCKPERRLAAAVAAAPYVHPRLQAVEHTGRDGKDLIPASGFDPLETARQIAFMFELASREQQAPAQDQARPH